MVSRAKNNTDKLAAIAAEGEEKATRTRVDYNAVQVGEFQPVENPGFRRTGSNSLPDDHPLVQAFAKSYEDGVALSTGTSTPELTEKALRKIAEDRGVGVTIKVEGDVVTFLAREKRARKTKEAVSA